jgi:Uma2 family endonuclease
MELVIDKQLVYEEMDGKPVYYKNYHKVLLSQATFDDVMGSSESQFVVISAVLKELYRTVDDAGYWIATNEAGLHISPGNNLAADIAIFNRTTAPPRVRNFKYQDLPPEVVIEVDIKADTSEFSTPVEYYRQKSRKLRDFGVGKVVWVNTEARSVMFNEDLAPVSWDTPFEVLPGLTLTIGPLVRKFVGEGNV